MLLQTRRIAQTQPATKMEILVAFPPPSLPDTGKNGQRDRFKDARAANALSWVGLVVVLTIMLAFWLGTKMLFVAGSIVLLAFAVGVVQSATHMHRTRPRKNAAEGVLNLLPHVVILVLVLLLLYVVGREFLRVF